jgi:hypothetical protein
MHIHPPFFKNVFIVKTITIVRFFWITLQSRIYKYHFSNISTWHLRSMMRLQSGTLPLSQCPEMLCGNGSSKSTKHLLRYTFCKVENNMAAT